MTVLVNLCVCVCLGLQVGHFGTAGPAMVRADFPLVKATSLLSVPLLGVPIPLLIYLACYRQPFPNTPTDLLPLGGTYAGLEVLRLILMQPGCHSYYGIPLREQPVPSRRVFAHSRSCSYEAAATGPGT